LRHNIGNRKKEVIYEQFGKERVFRRNQKTIFSMRRLKTSLNIFLLRCLVLIVTMAASYSTICF
jgi:hypothetical protein